MASIAAKRRSAGDIARLEALVTEQAAALADPLAFRRLDGQFHREIAAVNGNPIFTALVEGLFTWLSDFHVDLVSSPASSS